MMFVNKTRIRSNFACVPTSQVLWNQCQQFRVFRNQFRKMSGYNSISNQHRFQSFVTPNKKIDVKVDAKEKLKTHSLLYLYIIVSRGQNDIGILFSICFNSNG